MSRKTILDLVPDENVEKVKSIKEQIVLVDTIFPDGVEPAEIGQQALKLLLAEAQGFIKLDPELKKFWTKCADKYTPDAPKAIEVTKKESPAEYLEKSFEEHDVSLEDAEAFALDYGEKADERGKEVDAYEQMLMSDEGELTDAAYQRAVIAQSQDNS